jgi:hypothetical protein
MRTWMFILLFISQIIFIAASPKRINRTSFGCEGTGCHVASRNIFQVVPQNNYKIKIVFNNKKLGILKGAELIDSRGKVVDFVESSFQNPLILSAPAGGTYTIYGAIKTDELKCESEKITFGNRNFNIPDISSTLSKFELYSNHPNPFNKQTIIKFSLIKADFVELDIFTGDNKFVRNLVKSNYKAGIHHVVWDGLDQYNRPVSSGLYFYHIKTSDNSQTRRMVLKRIGFDLKVVNTQYLGP